MSQDDAYYHIHQNDPLISIYPKNCSAKEDLWTLTLEDFICRQWQEFPCVTNQQCRTWNTGRFCCRDSRSLCKNDGVGGPGIGLYVYLFIRYGYYNCFCEGAVMRRRWRQQCYRQPMTITGKASSIKDPERKTSRTTTTKRRRSVNVQSLVLECMCSLERADCPRKRRELFVPCPELPSWWPPYLVTCFYCERGQRILSVLLLPNIVKLLNLMSFLLKVSAHFHKFLVA